MTTARNIICFRIGDGFVYSATDEKNKILYEKYHSLKPDKAEHRSCK